MQTKNYQSAFLLGWKSLFLHKSNGFGSLSVSFVPKEQSIWKYLQIIFITTEKITESLMFDSSRRIFFVPLKSSHFVTLFQALPLIFDIQFPSYLRNSSRNSENSNNYHRLSKSQQGIFLCLFNQRIIRLQFLVEIFFLSSCTNRMDLAPSQFLLCPKSNLHMEMLRVIGQERIFTMNYNHPAWKLHKQ